MDYAGFYINLDRSEERRRGMEAQLAQFGLAEQYRRFPAADGNTLGFPAKNILPGEMGCFISHYMLLKENRGAAAPLHVIEDDVVFSRHAAGAIRSLIVEGRLGYYDIVYTDTHLPISNAVYKRYKDLYGASLKRDGNGHLVQLNLSVVDLKNIGFATTASMIISPRAIDKLHVLYEAELARGPEYPIDLFIRRKAAEGVLNVGCIFPFVTSVRLDDTLATTLGDADLRLVALAGTIARHSFFVDCDMKKCRDYALRHLRLDPDDIHLQVLMQVLGFSFGPQFEFTG